jgi:hypothetical protein
MRSMNMNTALATELEIFMREIGVMTPVDLDLEDDDDDFDPRQECMMKGYFRSPYDEDGNITF